MKIVGLNIKRAREENRFTLRQLADRIEVTASFLSQIETGKAYPSLQTLKRIADSLNTTVVRLVGDGQLRDKPVVTESERKVIHPFGKQIQMYLLAVPDAYKQMEPVLFKLDKDAVAEKLKHQHFGQEFALVLEGSIEITLADEKHILKQGDSIYFNSSIPHFFRNVGESQSVAVWVTTPPPS